MWLKRKPKRVIFAHWVDHPTCFIADYEYFWYTVELVFVMRFLAQKVSFSPIDQLPSFRNCFEDLSFKELCPRGTPDPSFNHIILRSLFPIFSFFDSFSHHSFTTSDMFLSEKKTPFSSPPTLIWSETSLFFESPVRSKSCWKYEYISFQPFRIYMSVLINSW